MPASARDYPQTVSLPTSLGNAEARKDEPNEPWEIGYPWKSDRYFGTRAEVQARMKAEIDQYEALEAEDQEGP